MEEDSLSSASFDYCGILSGFSGSESVWEMAAPEQPLPMSRGCQSSASLSPLRGDRTLLVRHLPAELTAEEKEDLLKYFGAQSVRVLSDKGRLVRAREPLVSGEDPRPVTWGREVLIEGKRRVGKMRLCSGGFLFPFPVLPLSYQNLFRPKSSFNWLVPRLVAALRKRAIKAKQTEWEVTFVIVRVSPTLGISKLLGF